MNLAAIEPTLYPDPWRFQLHLEVWALIVFLVGAWIYMLRVIGPKVAPEDAIVTKTQKRSFVAMILLLWLSTDWPMHDLAEEYLYSMHMLQHMMLSMFVPPLALLATPEWFFRLLIGKDRTWNVMRIASKPVVAAFVYNIVLLITHIPALVNRSAQGGPLHYFLHIILVTSALALWMPVCGPVREWQMSHGGKMIYLFAMSVVPTVPAGWLTFAEGSVYNHYETPVRVWGVSVLSDQQAAGAIMKLGGSVFMWAVIIYYFFKKFMAGFHEQQSYVRTSTPDDSEMISTNETLTYQQVEEAFGRVKPAPENPPSTV